LRTWFKTLPVDPRIPKRPVIDERFASEAKAEIATADITLFFRKIERISLLARAFLSF
jgi:hypothetical protein